MSIALYFDTETTGFIKKDAPLSEQPYVLQLACTLVDLKTHQEMACFNTILNQPITSIPAAASDVHGITLQHMHDFGISPRSALSTFTQLARRASIIIAHNIQFDLAQLSLCYQREQKTNPLDSIPRYCTMNATTSICRIPSTRGGYKWPKLSEAYTHLFNEPLIGAHDALIDVRACQRIHLHLNPPT